MWKIMFCFTKVTNQIQYSPPPLLATSWHFMMFSFLKNTMGKHTIDRYWFTKLLNAIKCSIFRMFQIWKVYHKVDLITFICRNFHQKFNDNGKDLLFCFVIKLLGLLKNVNVLFLPLFLDTFSISVNLHQ